MLDLRIVTGSNVPIYKQLVDQVRWGVATGAHGVGDTLPSVRALAEQLVINPNTVARAYAELTRDGVIEARPGKGYFIAEPRQVYSDEERARRLADALDAFLNEAIFLGYAAQEIRRALEQRLSHVDLPRGQRRTERR